MLSLPVQRFNHRERIKNESELVYILKQKQMYNTLSSSTIQWASETRMKGCGIMTDLLEVGLLRTG